MKKTALIVLAEGFEEAEAMVPVDVLRRAEVDVTVAGVGSNLISSARGVTIQTDVILEDYNSTPDALVFPGGLPGAEHLALSKKVKDLILKMNSDGRLIAAICASPALVLAPTGILSGKKATCYPGLEKNFSTDIEHVKDKVVQSGNIITSQGPATAFEYAFKIAENLVGKTKADMIATQMLFRR
ncbi:MAG: DJ-1/PfpI family protein [Candidatus Omnitrophica bacterium]|nr:DJ-1/PfpI family protein [Candidatus Omnitrophota bacterium]